MKFSKCNELLGNLKIDFQRLLFWGVEVRISLRDSGKAASFRGSLGGLTKRIPQQISHYINLKKTSPLCRLLTGADFNKYTHTIIKNLIAT